MWGDMRVKSPDSTRHGKPRGKHPDRRLNAVRVRNVTVPGRYADGNGLYLVVDESHAKRWLLRTVVAGKRCDIGLGSAQLVPLADAREEAARLRRMARAGGDPLAERRRERITVPTFKEAAEKVHAAQAASFRNPKHKADWISSLQMYAYPHFKDHRVNAVTAADILKALGAIWVSRPETARRVRQRLRTVFDWAKASGFRPGDNPVDGVARVLPRHKNEKAHHAAIPYRDVPSFVESVQNAAANQATKLAFEFLILTAARTSEVLGARWGEIDLEAKTWTVPASRIKAGREHRVPLSSRCIELLTEAQRLSDGGPFVFPGRYANKSMSNTVFLMLLRRIKRDEITAHGFRSAFRDWAAERTSFSRSVCEAALAHVVENKTEAAYFRTDLFEQRRSLMDTWTAFATAARGDVVAFRA